MTAHMLATAEQAATAYLVKAMKDPNAKALPAKWQVAVSALIRETYIKGYGAGIAYEPPQEGKEAK